MCHHPIARPLVAANGQPAAGRSGDDGLSVSQSARAMQQGCMAELSLSYPEVGAVPPASIQPATL